MKIKDYDWISLGAALLIIAATTFLVTYYFNIQNQKCISEPLVYGAKQMEEAFGYEVHGSILLLIDNPRIQHPTITFNSQNLTIISNK